MVHNKEPGHLRFNLNFILVNKLKMHKFQQISLHELKYFSVPIIIYSLSSPPPILAVCKKERRKLSTNLFIFQFSPRIVFNPTASNYDANRVAARFEI